jgi:hypothetical protein
MPVEYYLGIFVAVVILVLLASLLRGRASRQKLANNGETAQLTQQLTRIADSLEALLIQLKTSSVQPVQWAPVSVQPSPQLIPPREAQGSPQTLPPPPPSQPPAQSIQPEKPGEPKSAEPSGTVPAKSGEPPKPSKQHVVLSMFGR